MPVASVAVAPAAQEARRRPAAAAAATAPPRSRVRREIGADEIDSLMVAVLLEIECWWPGVHLPTGVVGSPRPPEASMCRRDRHRPEPPEPCLRGPPRPLIDRVRYRACTRLHRRPAGSKSCEQSAKKTAKISAVAATVGEDLWSCTPSPRKPGPLVLVVEDEPEIAALMRDFLEADGFRVQIATHAEQAAGGAAAGAGLRAAGCDASRQSASSSAARSARPPMYQ